MKTCNSSRVIYHNHHPQHIISNVPTRRLDGDTSSVDEATRGRRSSSSGIHCSNHTNKVFSLRNVSFIIQGCILFLVLSSAVHQARGSHLPSNYIVQKINSNNHEYKIIVRNSSSSSAEELSSTTPVGDTSTTTRVPETSTNTIVTPEEEPGPLESIVDTLVRLHDVIGQSSPESTFTSATEKISTTPMPGNVQFTNSYEENVDPKQNYVSEHDHYDEYAILKAALEKEKVVDELSTNNITAGERHPFLLQAADGRKYASIEAFCDDRQLTISGNFDDIFKGRIYALGYSDEAECGANNAKEPSNNITFSLPLGSCGVQMLALDDNLENDLRHEVTLYIQYSAFLQQVVDEKISVSCTEIKRSPVEDFLTSNEQVITSNRQGRRMGSLGDIGKYGSTKITSRIGEAWMEILAGKDPSPKSRKMSPVSVGEDVTLVISTKVLRGYDARIVNCSAHDGSRTILDGSRAQQILDSAGCSIDRSLVPNLRRRRLPIESRNRLITLHFATFPAFKFPERDHLHIKCAVAYCQGPCPQEPCDSVLNHFGSWRDKYGRIADVLIDSTEVVNSVEVIAPELDDLGRGLHYERMSPMASGSYSSLSGGNSPPPASPSEISGRQFPSEQASSYRYSRDSNGGNSAASAAPSVAASSDQQSMYSSGHQMNSNSDIHGAVGNSVCVSPGTVILALVILGVVLVISATATLWFALKRSEAKKYRHIKHSPFQHAPQPYYRFSHW